MMIRWRRVGCIVVALVLWSLFICFCCVYIGSLLPGAT